MLGPQVGDSGRTNIEYKCARGKAAKKSLLRDRYYNTITMYH